MMKILSITLLILALIAVVLWYGKLNWSQYVSTQIQKINGANSHAIKYVNLEEVKDLPEPVKRYFHLILKNGAPIINHAFVSQEGGFRVNPKIKKWSKMEAKQYFSSIPRSFVWNAKISIFPGMSINVCDSYIEGKGGMKGKVLSLFTLIDAQKQNELDEGALQRYLAEAVWFPTALLPSQGIIWTALDAHRAKATIKNSGTIASLEFEFNENGEAISVYTPVRYRMVSGKYEATPWKGKFSKYVKVDDYKIPLQGEVEWHLKDQTYSYWRASLRDIKYG